MIVSLTKRPLALLAALVFALAVALGTFASAASADHKTKYAFCHATGSETNPFVLVVVGNPTGHAGHANDVFLGPTQAHSPAQ